MPQTGLSAVVAACDPTDAQVVEFAMDHRPPQGLNLGCGKWRRPKLGMRQYHLTKHAN
jgi:hypothetical protein